MDSKREELKKLLLFKFKKQAIYFVNKIDSIIPSTKKPLFTNAILIHSGFQSISNEHVVHLNVIYQKDVDEDTYEGLTHYSLAAIIEKVMSGEWKVMSSNKQKEDKEIASCVENKVKSDNEEFDYSKK